MRALISPDKLRGTYTAAEAADAIGRGWAAVRPHDELHRLPLADGGEGTAAALLAARGGRWVPAQVHDARGRLCEAEFALLADGSAALDVAAACGPLRVADMAPDAVGASSFGAGELIRAAISAGAGRIVVGVGGTASTDGGVGLRDALGAVPVGVELVAALDVDNPLVGPTGAAATYGPQKGATPEQVAELDRRLASLGLAVADEAGAGAGGGIGGMLMALGAQAVAGAELVMAEAGFDQALAGATLCITAEGAIDGQTLHGKVVVRIAERCAAAAVACVAIGGRVDVDAAAELARRGCRTLEDGDLEHAGRLLARQHGDATSGSG
jgi:glycerate 2-kinase